MPSGASMPTAIRSSSSPNGGSRPRANRSRGTVSGVPRAHRSGRAPALVALSSAWLDGPWAFWPDLEGHLPTGPGGPYVASRERDSALGPPRAAHVPGPWQAQFEDLHLWAGTAWYERDFAVPAETTGVRVRLSFGAVDYFTTVWVNGRLAGEHEGGYLPFAFDVTDLVYDDRPNTVTLRVLDVGPGDEDGPFPFSQIPHGKQSWYGPVGGPWQPVGVEKRPDVFVDGLRIDADLPSGELTASIRLDGAARDALAFAWRIRSSTGGVVATGISAEPVIHAHVAEVQPWDLGAPNLYQLDVELRRAGAAIDRASDRFGFRTVDVRDGRVTLNGRPIYLLGALDQDYWMPGIMGPADETELAQQMVRATELGLNLLRCHIKLPDPRYLDAADRAGLLVWCEPPSWMDLTEPAKRQVRDMLAGMVERDWNHPSLVIRSIVNEDWGTHLAADESHRAWLRDTYNWLRSADPSRLVVDNSACPPNFHLESDLNDYHVYRAVPEQSLEWREWTSAWARDPYSTYSPHGDASIRGSEPLVVSEFGIWGLPDTNALVDEAGREPWWFDTGRGHSEGIVHPAGVRDRFVAWNLDEAFGSWDAFVRASQEHEFDGLQHEIQELRLQQAIAGYVITELTDVHWEANGLLDMRRRPKAFHDRLARVNAPDVVIIRPERRRLRSGERVVAEVHTVGATESSRGRVEWQLEGSGLGGVVHAGNPIVFDVPSLERPTRASLRARWRDDADRIVNETTEPLWLAPERGSSREPTVAVVARWDDVAARVEAGGRAVIVAEDGDALPTGASIALESFGSQAEGSNQSIYENGWLMSTGMEWLSRSVCEGLDIGPRVDLAFEGMTPRFVIAGYDEDSKADLLAGHFLGWLHRMRATIAGVSHGRGAALVCTFPLLEHDTKDPLATAMLDRLADIVAKPGFAPRWTI
jgi:hypothetical protein